ncbi:MAG: hypothetical protein ABIP27_16585 [Flavobacterium circumlabens]|uniref:hypothetical protein n=1 Tax=Flavobacterium circumlabens TaxID=2133765 RepID=UPI0032640B1F
MKKISIILLVILFIGCRTVKTVDQSQETRKDSVSYIDRIKVDTIRIPGETVTMKLPCDQLKPQSSAQGRANVKAEPKGDGYVVVFTCDSIEKLVISKNREIYRLSQELKNSNIEKTVELTFLQTLWINLGKLFVCLIILFIVVKLLVRWKLLR